MSVGKQFGKFVIVGMITALADIATMKTLLSMQIAAWICASMGFLVGLIVNYVLHTLFTFESRISFQRLGRFLIVILVNYSLTLVCVQVGLWSLDSAMLGKIISLPLVAVNGFLLSRFWVFR
jgi:putative flippase GtrA